MKILAVDVSTSSGSVALLDEMELRAEWSLHSTRTHNRRLLKTIDLLLHQVDWTVRDVDGFAVTLGPGSFTGIRIGISTMKTLSWVLRKPYAGISTLDALAAPLGFAALPVCAVLDARRKELYVARYQPDGSGACRRISPYLVTSPEQVLREIRETTLFCGDGWLLHRDWFLSNLGDRAVELPPPFHTIRASSVAELARRKFLQGASDDPMSSVPLYVRPSEAELHQQAAATIP
jgi:tRNA threonylcarbamoyladenosine biosynthesis protein TsaB